MAVRTKKGTFIHFLYAIFLFSLMICGICILIFGCWLKLKLNDLADISTYLSYIVPLSIIIVGAILISVALFGFTCPNHPRWLLLYGYWLLIFFALTFFLFLTVYYYCPDVNDSLSNELKMLMTSYKPNSKCYTIMDGIQTKFACCGNNDADDWLKTEIAKIPQACCKFLPCNTNDRKEIFEEGCRTNIRYLIMEKKTIIQALLLPAAIILFIGTAITFYYGIVLTHQLYANSQI